MVWYIIVTSSGSVGYVSSSYVSVATKTYAKTTGTNLNLRRTAKIEPDNIITSIPNKGYPVPVISGEFSSWPKVIYRVFNGFASSDFLQFSDWI